MKKILMILLMFLLMLSCGKTEKVVETKPEKQVDEKIFKEVDVDKLSEKIEQMGSLYGLAIEDFSDLSSDGKVFYYAKINENKDQIITINYENLTPTAIVGKVISTSEEDIEIFNKLALVIIRASDTNLTDEDAQMIFKELLIKLENEISVSITTKNNITYAIEIIGLEDAMVFYAK